MTSLVCIGYDVDLDLVDGRAIRIPDRAAMLYDKTGADWPRTSVLFTAFERAGATAKGNRFAREWFGADYNVREGRCVLPPRELSSGGWREVGEVVRIAYTRGSGDARDGAKHAGAYEHTFAGDNPLDVFTFMRRPLPKLYRAGRAWRLEIGRWYAVTGRGIVNA